MRRGNTEERKHVLEEGLKSEESKTFVFSIAWLYTVKSVFLRFPLQGVAHLSVCFSDNSEQLICWDKSCHKLKCEMFIYNL